MAVSRAQRDSGALAVGVLALVWPATALAVLVALFGVYVLADGLVLVGLQGLVGILAGVVAIVAPQGTALAAASLLGAWAILTGLLEAAVALRLTAAVPVAGLIGVGGVLSVVLGVLLLRSPEAGALLFARLFGAYQLAAGAVLLTLAARLRHAGQPARAGRIGNPAAASELLWDEGPAPGRD